MTLLDDAVTLADGPGPTPGWDTHTPCQTNPDVYFPLGGDNAAVKAAHRLCARCPVQLDCLADGIRAARAQRSPGIRAGHGVRAIREAAKPGRAGLAARRAIRATAVRAAAEGATAPQLAVQYGVSERTMQRWLATAEAA